VISTLHYGRSAHSPVHEPPLWQPERSQQIKAAERGFLPDTVTWALRVPTEDYPLIYDRAGSGYGRAAAWVSAAVAQVGPSLGGSLCLASGRNTMTAPGASNGLCSAHLWPSPAGRRRARPIASFRVDQYSAVDAN
jgi:hypothetical protein